MNVPFAPRSSWPAPDASRLPPTGSSSFQAAGTSFTDETSQMKVVVLENVSMVFHERFESEADDLSLYDYSVEAPSFLCEKEAPRRFDSSEYAANRNVSQYFRLESSRNVEERRDDSNDTGSEQPERPSLQRDTSGVLGSLPALLASTPHSPVKSEQTETHCRIAPLDHETYTATLLGIGEDDEGTAQTSLSMDSSDNYPTYESPKQHRRKRISDWFRFSGKAKKDNSSKKNEKSAGIVKSLPLARKAPPKRSVSDLRRASF